MKGGIIALDHWHGREAAALMMDGRLEDLLIDHDRPRPGAIYRGVVDRAMPGQGGVFLRTPDGMAFLRRGAGLSQGHSVLCQVTGFAEPGKAIPVTQRLLFKSRYAIVTPGAPGLNVSRRIRGDDLRDAVLETAHDTLTDTPLPVGSGLILRSSCALAEPAEIAADIGQMATLAAQVLADAKGAAELLVEGDGPHALAWRDWTDPAQLDTEGSFTRHGVDDRIDALRVPTVALAGGYSMVIEPTTALVAVDINTGGDTAPAAGLKANLAALRDLPRQLRLRGLGGQIVIDPAPVPKRDRRQLEQVLRAGLKREAAESVLAGWTTLGLMEIQRKRDRLPLKEILP
jgi:Ribonuclease G/E